MDSLHSLNALDACTLVLPHSQHLPQVIMEIESLRFSGLLAIESINQISFWAGRDGLLSPFSQRLKPPFLNVMRLNKYIAHSGVASRRHSDDLIIAGRVAVNGETVNNSTKLFGY